MKNPNSLIVFALDDRRYALPLPAANRVVRMVAITPLPKAPDIVLGMVNIQGRVIPVVNMRRRFCLPEREITLTDRLVADAVLDVITYPAQELIAAEHIAPGVEYVEGVIKLEDGLILIHDLDKFLSLEEENSLDRALENGEPGNSAPEPG